MKSYLSKALYIASAAALMMSVCLPAAAHVDGKPSIHDVVADVLERMKATYMPEALGKLTVSDVERFLTDEERDALGSQYLTFTVNVPTVVTVLHDQTLGDDPFWLKERGFKKTGLGAQIDGGTFEAWEKSFDAGEVGLGVNSLSGGGDHYVVALRPQDKDAALEVSDIYPALHTTGTLEQGAVVYPDDNDAVEKLPGALDGQLMIRGYDDREEDGQLINVFLLTPYPASPTPDHVVLTWSGDPKTTQTIQWRTDTSIETGVVEYMKKSEYAAFRKGEPKRVEAERFVFETDTIVNDPVVHRFTAVLEGLEPGTTYVYSIGNGQEWSELAEFTTAPDGVEPFSFVYMGDAQNGLERWGSLVQGAHRRVPHAAFYIMAGDLVNRGADRDDWDTFFQNAEGVYNHKQLVPALGNHEYGGNSKGQLYVDQFALPDSSPVGEKAYSFTYSNAFFVVLDSNLPVDTQSDWLDEQLAGSDATWKFVVYHHPAYSSGVNRNNADIRKVWGGILDKYHVDVALQGHDHAYLRTWPMHGEKRVETPAEGTIYIVSVSGTKFYDQGDFDYTEFGMTNTATYQVLDLMISGDKLVYHAYDNEGNVRDSFTIEK